MACGRGYLCGDLCRSPLRRSETEGSGIATGVVADLYWYKHQYRVNPNSWKGIDANRGIEMSLKRRATNRQQPLQENRPSRPALQPNEQRAPLCCSFWESVRVTSRKATYSSGPGAALPTRSSSAATVRSFSAFPARDFTILTAIFRHIHYSEFQEKKKREREKEKGVVYLHK